MKTYKLLKAKKNYDDIEANLILRYYDYKGNFVVCTGVYDKDFVREGGLKKISRGRERGKLHLLNLLKI